MGHLAIQKPYLALQERLNKNTVGAPSAEALFEILRLRFTEEEAEIGARMPMSPAPLDTLSKRLRLAPDRLEATLDRRFLPADFCGPLSVVPKIWLRSLLFEMCQLDRHAGEVKDAPVVP